MKVKRPYLTYFLIAVGIIAVFELLFLFHAWVDAYSFEKIDSSGLITIRAAVLTIVFLVFSVMGLMNIDSRIKDLNETRERLSNMEREMKEEVRKMKVSAEEEKRKIIKKAEALTIMKSGEPDPNGVIQEKYYRYCLKLNPHFFPAALNLAMVYRERNEDGKAEQELSELITTSLFRPDFVKCIIQRGICTMKMNRFAEALNDFALAYVAAPKDPQVMCNLAWCHFRLGHIMEADEYAHVGREYAKIENNQGIVDDLTNLIGNIELMDSKIRAMQGR